MTALVFCFKKKLMKYQSVKEANIYTKKGQIEQSDD